MQTTRASPAFHSGQYATYDQNNQLCMGSDSNSNVTFLSDVPSHHFTPVFWTILSKKKKQFYRGILCERCPENVYIIKNDNEGALA